MILRFEVFIAVKIQVGVF